MNDMTTAGNGGAVATQDDNYDPYSAYARENSSNIVGKMLKFSKGDYFVGEAEFPIGTKLVANMANILLGWIRWEDQKPAETIMGLLTEGHRPQKRETLGHDDKNDWPTDKDGKPMDPWQATQYVVMKDEKDDELYTFVTNSSGGRGAITKLIESFGQKFRMNPGKFPIVELKVDSYKHKDSSYGRIKVPEFKIVGWVSKTVFDGTGEPEQDDTDTAEAARRIQGMADEKNSGGVSSTAAGTPRF
jgi:hypothetical protein